VAAGGRGHIQIYRPVGETVAYAWGEVPLDSKGVEDSVSVPNPALWFVTLLKQNLARHGITVTGGVRAAGWLERETAPLDLSKLVEVAAVSSRPLSEIVKNTLKPSQNQYAQLLLLQVGAKAENKPGVEKRDTEEEGLSEMRRFLAEAGVKRGMALLEEGSGLSRGALVTPSASVQLLTFMSRHRCRDVFYNALPIGGVDGTLRNRFKGTAAAGNVHAKTGSLGHVDTLSGYLTTKGNDKLVFSIMLNNYQSAGRHADGRGEIDTLVGMLADFTGKLP
jgi:D-alanyl-D-alanine carboxypeptidase/D-alanyl-D-alanine-endopeptidase (penicillin-binding protein 4)